MSKFTYAESHNKKHSCNIIDKEGIFIADKMTRHCAIMKNPAEMEKEIQKTVKKISEDKEIAEISSEESFEFDENGLKRYLKQVITEIKKERE